MLKRSNFINYDSLGCRLLIQIFEFEILKKLDKTIAASLAAH